MEEYRWSLGTLIGFPILVVIALVCLVAGVVFFVAWTRVRGTYDSGFVLGCSIVALVCAIFTVVGTAWGMWPYEGEYHQWRNTTGVVTEIDSRLLSDGNGGMNERFVVTFEDEQLRSCDDSRCTQVDEGDILTLACKRHWQWSGEHGYDCNYISHENK